jgi:hypothetical protein
MWGLKGFISIREYKKGYLVKNEFLLLEISIGSRVQKGFWEIFINI